MARVRALGMRSILLLALVLFGGFAHAQTPSVVVPAGTVNVFRTANGIKIYTAPGLNPSPGNPVALAYEAAFSQGPRAGAVAVAEAYAVPVAEGIAVQGVIARTIAAGAMADAALVLGVGFASYELTGAVMSWLGDSRMVPGSAGWQNDPGVAPLPGAASLGWEGGGFPGCHGSLAGLCGAHGMGTVVQDSPTAGRCYTDHSRPGYSDPYGQPAISGTKSCPLAGQMSCHASIDALNPKYSVAEGSAPMSDGKCRTGRYQDVSTAVAAAAIADKGSPTYAPQVAKEILSKGGPIAAENPGTLTGPASGPGEKGTTTTETKPDANGVPHTTVTTTAQTNNYTYNVNNDSHDISITNGPTITTTTVDGAPAGTKTTDEKPIKPCGLPDSPACKIDETGTPVGIDQDPQTKIIEALKDPKKVATDPSAFFPKMPVLNWSFKLPTGCSAIPLAAFAPFLTAVDICQFQPTFHDLMSVVWIIGGLFGAVQLFLRDSLAS